MAVAIKISYSHDKPAHRKGWSVTSANVHTRLAMLEGIRSNDIIVGAYTDRSGGVCPMLAAHRAGGRTDFIAFAHAWDRFTHARRPRRATRRELRTLEGLLQATMVDDATSTAPSPTISARRASAARVRRAPPGGAGWRTRRRPRPPPTTSPDRS